MLRRPSISVLARYTTSILSSPLFLRCCNSVNNGTVLPFIKRYIGYLVVAIAGIILVACSSVDRSMMAVSDAISSQDPVTGAREINLTSERSEIAKANEISKKLLQQAQKKKVRYDGQLPEYQQIQRVFGRLRQVIHRKQLPWAVHLIDDKAWNAFTIGGGKVFVFRGLMQGTTGIRGEDELAAVLAHEMAHNTARHISEQEGKMMITRLADKNTRSTLYEASFSTQKEDEADKFSVIYMALAGYDPHAAVNLWERLAKHRGSYSATMTHTHPLNADRARALQRYAAAAKQYYIAGRINPNAAAILQCNAIFCKRNTQNVKSGQGGGTLALLETLGNTYMESQQAKTEATRRAQVRGQQQRQALQRLRLGSVRVVSIANGQKGASGVASNPSNRSIQHGQIRVMYLKAGKVVHQHATKWPPMKGGERKSFTMPLKKGDFDSVRLVPEYIQYVGE